MFYEKIMWLTSKYGHKPRFKEFSLDKVQECQDYIDNFHIDTTKYTTTDETMVGICLSIGKIEEVDTNKQTIKASIEMKLRIRSSQFLELDKNKFNYLTQIEKIKKDAEPNFNIINAVDENLRYKYITIIDRDAGIIDYNYHYICTLFDEVDVHNFPFDWQSFRVIVLLSDNNNRYTSLGYMDDKKYLDDNNCLGNKVFNNNTFIPDWNIYGLNGGTDTLELERSCMGIEILGEDDNPRRLSFVGTIEEGDNYFDKKLFSGTFWIQRKPFYVISSIWLINFIIMLMGGLSFKIPEEDLNDRMTFDATLLLTLVAQKFSFQDSVPKVSYLTLYDKKLLFNFVNLLFLMAIQGYKILDGQIFWQQCIYLIPVLVGEIMFFSTGLFKNRQIMEKG
ncbi:hypothetical protein CPAV1605_1399 [seawater metagenome]|uniref:Neurotransmitter-gated ion-channel ligand binding domain n=1 Tax=seawater metagenome TaxID=1561972 RepID=A0A5E8CKC3_9ZZZZ